MAQESGTVTYYEQQGVAKWINIGLCLLGIVIYGDIGATLLKTMNRPGSHDITGVCVIVFMAIFVLLAIPNLMFMRTSVDEATLTVKLGRFITCYRRRIPLSDIVTAEVVICSPIGDYGGWRIRRQNGGLALNMRGNRGVQLVLRNGDHLLIGSQRPEELLAALQSQDERFVG